MSCLQKELENAFHIWLVKVQDCVNCGRANSNCITVIVLRHLKTGGNFRLKRLGQTVPGKDIVSSPECVSTDREGEYDGFRQ